MVAVSPGTEESRQPDHFYVMMLGMNKNDSDFFGQYGGSFVPETLVPALTELKQAYNSIVPTSEFQQEFTGLLKHFVGRETPLYHAKRMSAECGFELYLKREDLNHTGAHKINNSLGQVLLAKRMGKTRIIAETGAGQHGVATATVCALLDIPCVVYMGAEDIERQALNVYRMKTMGAEVRSVESGSKTLVDATSQAIRDWMQSVENTHYVIGSVVGPAPYPQMVRDFQSVIGNEAKVQCREAFDGLPDYLVACVGGGSNAMGLFAPFFEDDVRFIAVEAAGEGADSGRHSLSLAKGLPGVLHGSKSSLLQNEQGHIAMAHSVSAGLDYPGVGPELSYLRDEGRLTLGSATDDAAIEAMKWCARTEGIIPALETSHAFAYLRQTSDIPAGSKVVLNCSGRGDKDMGTLMAYDS